MSSFSTEQLVAIVTDQIYENDPSLLDRFGERGKEKCIEDNHHHLKHLHTAYELDSDQVFIDYALWLNGILVKHGMSRQHLLDNFLIIEDVLLEMDDHSDMQLKYISYLRAGREALNN